MQRFPRYISPYYSINYDWAVALYSETNPGSKERLIRIEIQNEIYEKLIDDISNQLKSLDATDRFVVVAIYKSGFANMDLMAAQDAMPNKKIKQSKDRIERKLFEDCVRGK